MRTQLYLMFAVIKNVSRSESTAVIVFMNRVDIAVLELRTKRYAIYFLFSVLSYFQHRRLLLTSTKECPPCLNEECLIAGGSEQSEEDFCNICFVDDLKLVCFIDLC